MAISKESCGLLYLLLSAILFSISGTFLKKAGEFGIPSTEMVFFRAVFQGFFVFLGMCCFRTNPSILDESDNEDDQDMYLDQEDRDLDMDQDMDEIDSKTTRLIFVPFGQTRLEKKVVIARGVIGGGFGFLCYFYAIKSLPLGDAVTLFSLYPIYTIFLAKIFLDEPITCRHFVIAVLCVCGGTLIAGPSFLNNERKAEEVEDTKYNPLGYIVALMGSVFASSVVILIRKAGTLGLHTLQLLASWSIFGVIMSILVGMTFGRIVEGMWIQPPNKQAWLFLFGTCVFGGAAHGLLNYAGRNVPAGQAAIVRSTDILWAYLLEVFYFRETPTVTTIVGVLMICISMVTLALEKFEAEREKQEYDLLNKEARESTKEFELT